MDHVPPHMSANQNGRKYDENNARLMQTQSRKNIGNRWGKTRKNTGSLNKLMECKIGPHSKIPLETLYSCQCLDDKTGRSSKCWMPHFDVRVLIQLNVRAL